MAVRRAAIGRITVLSVIGGLTGGDETDQLREAILGESAAGNILLVLDLSACGKMNSTGISVLVEAYRDYAGRGGEIRLCGLHQRMANQLATVRIIDFFGRHATVDEAVAAFAERASKA
jgi:anti-sigma B factor antagonist